MPYWGAFFVTLAFAFVGGVLIERVDHPAGGERADSRRRHRHHRAAGDLQQRRRLDLHLHAASPSRARSPKEPIKFGEIVFGAHDLGQIGVTLVVLLLHLPVLPLHAARAGDARGGAEPGVEPARRHPRRLDAGAGLGPGRGVRRGGRHDGGADPVPRPEHDGRRADLRLRRGDARRLRPARSARWSAGSSSACWRTCVGTYVGFIGTELKFTVALVLIIVRAGGASRAACSAAPW